MQPGKKAPFISQQSVRLALDMLVYSTRDRQTPLLSLLLVDEFLSNPDLPDSPHSREFALYQVLTSVLVAQLAHQRSVLHYSLPQPSDPKVVVVQLINKDVEVNSLELLGWSWLYHHYVRVDLNIHSQEFCDLVHIDARTLRRYQQNTIKHLTNILIEMEWDARIRQRKRRLLSELPTAAVFAPLIGREEESDYIRQMLSDAQPPHFQIIGARGIGKTALVESTLREQIDTDAIDQLIWMQAPISVAYISHYLKERLLSPESKITLREYLLTHRTVIVLDDIDSLRDSGNTLSVLLVQLNPAIIFMTCSSRLAVLSTVQITLNEISEQDTYRFTQSLLKKIKNPALTKTPDDYAHQIWEHAGGNPLAIQLLTTNHSLIDLKNFSHESSFHAIFHHIFQAMDKNAQTIWLAFTLLPPQEIEFNELNHYLRTYIARADINTFLQYHLVERSRSNQSQQHRRYRLLSSARRYIEDMYKLDSSIHLMVNDVIQNMNLVDNAGQGDSKLLSVVEYILQSTWLALDENVCEAWITKWWVEGVRCQHWSTWRLLLERQVQRNPLEADLCMGYAICLRRLGEWYLAEQVFLALISETGRRGMFLRQAEALLELSILLRYRGEYERVVELLVHGKRIAATQKSDLMLSAIAVEQAQVALDLHDLMSAETFIADLSDSSRVYLLKSELFLFQGNYEQARSFSQLAIKGLDKDFSSYARIYTLIGRAFEQQNELETAQEYLTWAVMILEQQEDVFALARAQSNLASLFIRTGHYEEAEILLSAAEKIQLQLNDRVALAATLHNLRLLEIALSS
jgi:tetratricopeptide (TPR) repeat protein